MPQSSGGLSKEENRRASKALLRCLCVAACLGVSFSLGVSPTGSCKSSLPEPEHFAGLIHFPVDQDGNVVIRRLLALGEAIPQPMLDVLNDARQQNEEVEIMSVVPCTLR